MAIHMIGLISDTHGLIRPEALEALQGSELIIHAGDIGDPSVLDALRMIAPVVAVRGNTDADGWADALPWLEVVEVGNTFLYVIHELEKIDLNPAAAGFAAVICGHSHRPSVGSLKGVPVINPGSAGPRRFKLPVSVALIRLKDALLEPIMIELKIPSASPAR